MNNGNDYNSYDRSDAYENNNGNSYDTQRAKRPRINRNNNPNNQERRSYNPNFDDHNRRVGGARPQQGGNRGYNDGYGYQQGGGYPQRGGNPRGYNNGGYNDGYYDQRGGNPRPYNDGYNDGYYNDGYNGGYNDGYGYQQGGYSQRGGNPHGGYNPQGANSRRPQQPAQGRRKNAVPMPPQGKKGMKPAANGKPQKKAKAQPKVYPVRKPAEYSQEFVDYSKPVRLNKFLANAGVCSRREADEYIQAGVVRVNNDIVTELGVKVVPATDKIYFHDTPVQIEKKVYILLNKPKNTVTTSDDPQERHTVLDYVRNACPQRVYPVGRLDRNTTGVMLITNDGDLASKLTHPKYDRKKIYEVRLDKDVALEDLEKLRTGIVLEDGEIHADEISYLINNETKAEEHHKVGIEIHSGRNRIVRRMFEALGYKVTKLDRVYFCGLTKKNLSRGKWRFLSESEVNILKMQ